MKAKTIFEIPIYSMKEEIFNARWNKYREEEYLYVAKGKKIDAERKRILDEHNFPMYAWKYNQIIGYIVISVQNKDIVFDIFCSIKERYYAKSKFKTFMQNWLINGEHFLTVNLSEQEIKDNIILYLRNIEANHLNNKFYVDYSTFNNVLPFIDIKKIIEKDN